MVVAQIKMLKIWEIEIGDGSSEGIVLEIQSSEKCQILNRVWNAAREGIEGEVEKVELRGERGRNIS